MSCVNIVDNDSTLVNPATFGQFFPCAARASNHDASATSRIIFNPNGTWQAWRTFSAANNGQWHIGAPANPADFEIRFVGNINQITTTSGDPGCSTPALQEFNTPVDSGWLTLNVAHEQAITAYATANAICNMQDTDVTFDFTIYIRQISNNANAVSGSGSICASASAETM